MTQDQAITYLREYRRFCGHVFNESALYRSMRIKHRDLCYRRYLVSELIQRINDSDDDPIRTVEDVIAELDFVLGESDDDHFVTHRFAAAMEYEAHYILRYLRAKEKME